MGKTFCILYKWLTYEEIVVDLNENNKEFCYALVSLTTNDWYIGSTNNGWQRWKQHITDAKKVWNNKLSDRRRYCMMNIHKCMVWDVTDQ